MTTNKALISTRFDSDRIKKLESIAKKLHIAKNAVIENAFDIYAEEVLGVISSGDITIQMYEDRIKALEIALSQLQAKVISLGDITPRDNNQS